MIRLLVDAVRDVSARLASRRFALVLVLALPAVFALVFTAATAPALDGQARIPVAVVNLDEGIDGARGSTVNSGAELVDDLMDSSELAWDAVDEDTALAGLADGTYALVLEIPADYSERVASVDGSDPTRAQIRIISTGSENVLATRAGSAALKQVQSRLRANLGEQYMLRVLNSVNGQASTLSLTADGTVMLDSAYDALEQGAGAIAEGLEQTAVGHRRARPGRGRHRERRDRGGRGRIDRRRRHGFDCGAVRGARLRSPRGIFGAYFPASGAICLGHTGIRLA